MKAFENFAKSLGILTRSTGVESIPVAAAPLDVAIARAQVSRDPRTLDSVYRAVSILEVAVRQLTLDVWRGTDKLNIAPAIVAQPYTEMSQGAFLAETVQSLALRGNAYWRLRRNRGGNVYNVEVLNPQTVAVSIDKFGSRTYSWHGSQIKPSEIIHLRLNHIPGEALGLGPIQACQARIEGAIALTRYASNWTNQSGRPTGILSTDQVLTQQQAAQYKADANASMTPGNGIAVLGSGLSFKPILLSPSELQFLENQQADTIAVARMFGIPARLMLASPDGGTQTYANLEQDELTFLRYTVMAYIREIEEAFDKLTPRGNTCRFNLEGLLRTDTSTRYAAYKTAIEAGFLTVSEVRASEGLEPLNSQGDQIGNTVN
ncbi:phage portal protein [Arcanobacterium canis]